jgi:arginase family enzyme
METYGIPGINGLGKTLGSEITPYEFLEKERILELDNDNLELQEKKIYRFVKELNDKKTIFLGGDHSISFPLIQNFLERFPKGKILIFDAHPDLMKPMKEPTHEEWLRGIVEKKRISGNRVLLVGVRRNSENVDSLEIKYAKDKDINIIYSDEFDLRREEILDFVSSENIYLSFDLDVFDSSIFSATGYPEKEGLNEKQVFEILKKLKEKIYWSDVVEYNLHFDLEDKGKKILEKVLKTLKGD